jgi:hypothetical protein
MQRKLYDCVNAEHKLSIELGVSAGVLETN